jgi:flagellar biosynthetic protein FliQ
LTTGFVLTVLTQGIILVLLLSAPMLLTGLVVGFIVALLQTITSIQEQTLSFVPKAIAVLLVLVLVAPWMLNTTVGYVTRLFGQIPAMVP